MRCLLSFQTDILTTASADEMALKLDYQGKVFCFILVLSVVFVSVTFFHKQSNSLLIYKRPATVHECSSKDTTQGSNAPHVTKPPFSKAPHASKQANQMQVILSTFGRSGSSFTSKLIAHNENVFYFFEPLFFLSSARKARNIPKHLLNQNHTEYTVRVMESYLTCDFDKDTYKALYNIHPIKTDSIRDLELCFTPQQGGYPLLDCYFQFRQKCLNHTMTFVKTIRFPVERAQSLMARYPNMKILYLIRDPRATLLSQSMVFGDFKLPRDAREASANHCKSLGQDLEDLRRFQGLFQDRIKVIRYEDAAMNPHKFAVEIYKFLGLPITQDLLDYVTYLTSPRVESLSRSNENKTNVDRSKPNSVPSNSSIGPLLKPGNSGSNLDKQHVEIVRNLGDLSQRDDAQRRFGHESTVKDQQRPKRRQKRAIVSYETQRDDPVKTMQRWRKWLRIEATSLIDEQCGHLYDQLGYKTVSTQSDLENTEISLVTSPKLESTI